MQTERLTDRHRQAVDRLRNRPRWISISISLLCINHAFIFRLYSITRRSFTCRTTLVMLTFIHHFVHLSSEIDSFIQFVHLSFCPYVYLSICLYFFLLPLCFSLPFVYVVSLTMSSAARNSTFWYPRRQVLAFAFAMTPNRGTGSNEKIYILTDRETKADRTIERKGRDKLMR